MIFRLHHAGIGCEFRNLRHADLLDSNLKGADVRDADFRHINMNDVYLTDTQKKEIIAWNS